MCRQPGDAHTGERGRDRITADGLDETVAHLLDGGAGIVEHPLCGSRHVFDLSDRRVTDGLFCVLCDRGGGEAIADRLDRLVQLLTGLLELDLLLDGVAIDVVVPLDVVDAVDTVAGGGVDHFNCSLAHAASSLAVSIARSGAMSTSRNRERPRSISA